MLVPMERSGADSGCVLEIKLPLGGMWLEETEESRMTPGSCQEHLGGHY